MAMKIMRLRVSHEIKHSFRCIPQNENIKRRDLEDRTFIEDKVKKKITFLKSIPNSVQCGAEQKRDLFAMIRQLGKPTAFVTPSANEIRWPHVLKILYSLNDYYKNITAEDPLRDLTRSMRRTLVNEDPVTCCIYF
jgi:hypothetical protein